MGELITGPGLAAGFNLRGPWMPVIVVELDVCFESLSYTWCLLTKLHLGYLFWEYHVDGTVDVAGLVNSALVHKTIYLPNIFVFNHEIRSFSQLLVFHCWLYTRRIYLVYMLTAAQRMRFEAHGCYIWGSNKYVFVCWGLHTHELIAQQTNLSEQVDEVQANVRQIVWNL